MVSPKPHDPDLRARLLRWYRKNRRDLPWRHTRDPYAIWVSEVMLQQTQVNTVIPYYQKFLKRFPTLKKLAQAKEETVLANWSGLGYYRRAKLLHRGAREVLKNHQGTLPHHPEALKKIPGIGDYTAGAIASIAFGKPVPLVDGNVLRVLSRIFALKGHGRHPHLHRKIWQLAGSLVPSRHAGDFNQALMELGATLCRVNLPACDRCPLLPLCQAGSRGKAEEFPERPPPGKVKRLHRVAAICQRNGGILLVKRKKPRWFQGMWQLPHDYCPHPDQAEAALNDFLKEALGLRLRDPQALRATRHSITHHRITTHAWRGKASGRLKKSQLFDITKFFPYSQINELPLPNLDRKVLKEGNILTEATFE